MINEAEKIVVCPYCGNELSETWSSCCGEAGHGEEMYLLDNELYTYNEIINLKESETIMKEYIIETDLGHKIYIMVKDHKAARDYSNKLKRQGLKIKTVRAL